MLYPEYKKDINCFRLIFPDKNPVGNDYQYEMLLHNDIEGIMPFVKQFQNGMGSYSYDISNKISLQKMYDSVDMSYENIKDLFVALQRVVNRMQEYLLDEACLLLHEDFVFYDADTRQIQFIFYPYPEDCYEYTKGFCQLSEFLIAHTDHEDDRAVTFVYDVYRESREEYFTLQNIIGKLENNDVKEVSASITSDFDECEKETENEIEDGRMTYDVYYRDKVSREKKKRLIISSISLILFAVLLVYVLFIKKEEATLAEYIMGILFLSVPLFLWFDYRERVR